MWFPSFFQTLNFTQRGRVLFALVLAIFVGALIGISQGPSPRAEAAFDVQPVAFAPAPQASIVGEPIPLPTQPPADGAAVSAATVAMHASAPAEILPTDPLVRNVSGVVVARGEAFAPEPSQHSAFRMASAFAGVDSFGAPPVPEQWPGFASLGGDGGTMVAGAESSLMIDETETAADTPPESYVAAKKTKPAVESKSEAADDQTPAAQTPAAQPVPEPSSFLLMLFAVLGLATMARRLRQGRF